MTSFDYKVVIILTDSVVNISLVEVVAREAHGSRTEFRVVL